MFVLLFAVAVFVIRASRFSASHLAGQIDSSHRALPLGFRCPSMRAWQVVCSSLCTQEKVAA